MPRQARMTSATNVYHVILRGVNKQQVFEDEEDYMRFLNPSRSSISSLPMRKASVLAPSHDSQAFHTPSSKGRQAGHSVAVEW